MNAARGDTASRPVVAPTDERAGPAERDRRTPPTTGGLAAQPRWAQRSSGEASVDRELLAPFRLASVRVGLEATAVVIVAVGLYPFLGGAADVQTTLYATLVALAALGGIVVGLLPWPRLLTSPVGEWVMYAWSVLDIAIITGLIVAADAPGSGFDFIYVLTTIFFAITYPRRGQVGLLLVTVACYLLAVALTGWDLPTAEVFLRLTILAVVAFMTSFIAQQLVDRVTESRVARDEADRRAFLLARVAGAARGMSALDVDAVLEAVVTAVASLGFETATICLLHDEDGSYELVHPRGIPALFAEAGRHESDQGVVGMVLARRSTVVVDDYANHEHAVPVMAAEGFRAVVATPIWRGGRIEATLVAATRAARSVSAEEVEALELLAGQAGRALDNARRYADERRTVQRLAEIDQLKRDFVSNVSHELRTPITVISGLSQTLSRRWDQIDEDKRRALFSRVAANADSLDDIIATLLDFSKLEAGGLDLRLERLDLAVVAEATAERLDPLFDQHELIVEVGGPLPVEGDRTLLERVLVNLLSNAHKHTPPGTTVHLVARERGAVAEVVVSDTGPGMSAEAVRHLGDRFYRGGEPDTRSTRGLGLGLALVNEILALHHARLDVDSRPGHGTRFAFRLPLVTAAP